MVPLHTEMARHSHHGLFLLFTMSWRIFIFIVACTGTVIGWDPLLLRRCLVKIIFQNEISVQDLNKGQLFYRWGFPCDSVVKNLPVMQETQVSSPGGKDLLEKGMPTHSSIPAWRIPWTGEPGVLQPTGLQRVRQDWTANTTVFYMIINNQASVHVIFIYT